METPLKIGKLTASIDQILDQGILDSVAYIPSSNRVLKSINPNSPRQTFTGAEFIEWIKTHHHPWYQWIKSNFKQYLEKEFLQLAKEEQNPNSRRELFFLKNVETDKKNKEGQPFASSHPNGGTKSHLSIEESTIRGGDWDTQILTAGGSIVVGIHWSNEEAQSFKEFIAQVCAFVFPISVRRDIRRVHAQTICERVMLLIMAQKALDLAGQKELSVALVRHQELISSFKHLTQLPLGSNRVHIKTSVENEVHWWVELLDGGALAYEGLWMRHCVAGFAEELKNKKVRFFSLRSADSKPKLTVEVVDGAVLQIKGRAQAPIKVKYKKALEDLLKYPVGFSKLKISDCADIWDAGWFWNDEEQRLCDLWEWAIQKIACHDIKLSEHFQCALPEGFACEQSILIEAGYKYPIPKKMFAQRVVLDIKASGPKIQNHWRTLELCLENKTFSSSEVGMEVRIQTDTLGCLNVAHLSVEKIYIEAKSIHPDGHLEIAINKSFITKKGPDIDWSPLKLPIRHEKLPKSLQQLLEERVRWVPPLGEGSGACLNIVWDIKDPVHD